MCQNRENESNDTNSWDLVPRRLIQHECGTINEHVLSTLSLGTTHLGKGIACHRNCQRVKHQGHNQKYWEGKLEKAKYKIFNWPVAAHASGYQAGID